MDILGDILNRLELRLDNLQILLGLLELVQPPFENTQAASLDCLNLWRV